MNPIPTTFLERASFTTSKGIPVTPVKLDSKAAFLPEWEKSATTDPQQIGAWSVLYPGCNCAAVATGQPDAVWFFEADSRDVFARIKAETGHDLMEEVPTFMVRSREGRGHLYFRNTPAALAMGNLAQTYVKHGDFSVRVRNQYVVGAFSVHPITKLPYLPLNPDATVLPAPDWFVEWLNNQRVEKKKDVSAKDTTPRNESGKVPHGYMHGFLVHRAGKMREAGMEVRMIEPSLLDMAHDECEAPIDDSKVIQIAQSMEKYDKGTKWEEIALSVSIGEKAKGDANALLEDEEETFEDDKQERFPEFPMFTGVLTDLATAMFPSLPMEFKQWALITRWGLVRSGVDVFAFEPHLQPRFYSVLVCYPNRGKTACINESRNIFDVINTGVREAIEKSGRPRTCSIVENVASADSGQFLADDFFKRAAVVSEDVMGGRTLDNTAKVLLDPDEMSDIFEKGRSLNGRQSTLLIELLKLYSGNRTGNGTKKQGQRNVTNAHLAILGGTTVKKYPLLWIGTGGGADGLVSRVVPITTNNPPLPPAPLRSNQEAMHKAVERLIRLAQLPGQKIALDDEASAMLNHWWASFDNNKDSATRVLETIKQLLIVLAVTNAPEDHAGTKLVVGKELMGQAIAFGKYLIAVRERLTPADSWNHVQAMENAIIDCARKYTSRKEPKTRREFRRGIHPERMPGGFGAFLQAWRNCIDAEVLKLRDKAHVGGRYSV